MRQLRDRARAHDPNAYCVSHRCWFRVPEPSLRLHDSHATEIVICPDPRLRRPERTQHVAAYTPFDSEMPNDSDRHPGSTEQAGSNLVERAFDERAFDQLPLGIDHVRRGAEPDKGPNGAVQGRRRVAQIQPEGDVVQRNPRRFDARRGLRYTFLQGIDERLNHTGAKARIPEAHAEGGPPTRANRAIVGLQGIEIRRYELRRCNPAR